jgi:hypothetical protein
MGVRGIDQVRKETTLFPGLVLPLTPIYMTTLFPGLVQALQQNVPLTPICMTTLFPSLVYTSNIHMHDHSLSWLGLYL